ncbi:thiol reductant ABC exporter subunit CydD [Patulibacter minatonensis]|uniref:thiol reductant ABC exporter subunit CydD n=1 Tax=Patulibacter minatonensis TaxID=298163 RepID=UPI0006868398|nr:thiol reductant ABC exporter subunit CydD [Patulibacter minatonensis]
MSGAAPTDRRPTDIATAVTPPGRAGTTDGVVAAATVGEPTPRDVHRRLLALSPTARVLIAGTVACGAVVAALVIVQAWVIADVVGGAVDGRDPAIGAIVLLVVAVLVRALAAGGTELLGRRAAEAAGHALRVLIARRALGGRSAAPDEARRGDVVTAAVQGVDALGDYYARAVPAIALAGGVPVLVVGVIAWRQPVVGGLLAVTLPVLVVFMVLVGRSSAEHARERQRALAVLGAHFLEVVRALPTLRAHGRERAQTATLDAVAERYRVESLGALRVAFLSALVLELFAMLGIAIAAATTGVLLATGHAELSTGLFVLLLAPEVYAPLRAAGQRFHAAEDGAQAARRAFLFLDEAGRDEAPGDRRAWPEGDPDDRPRAQRGVTPDPPRRSAGLVPGSRPVAVPDPVRDPIVLRGVSVAGSAGRRARLQPLDLDLVPGRSVALVGPSGAGKTTLLRLLARLQDPTAGTIRCGDVDLLAAAPESWWRSLVWLPQRPGLPEGTLGEALRTGSGAAWGDGPDAGRTARALHLAGAQDLVAALPGGLRTAVGPGGRVLSAGQTQRLALAGVLASTAPMVLLDEPTAHLDDASAERAAAGIVVACAGRTLVVATHDPGLAARCDVVVEVGGTGVPELLAPGSGFRDGGGVGMPVRDDATHRPDRLGTAGDGSPPRSTTTGAAVR